MKFTAYDVYAAIGSWLLGLVISQFFAADTPDFSSLLDRLDYSVRRYPQWVIAAFFFVVFHEMTSAVLGMIHAAPHALNHLRHLEENNGNSYAPYGRQLNGQS